MERTDKDSKDEASVVLSIIYGLIVVILAIVFKVTESVTDKAYLATKEYQCVLFAGALAWLIGFKLYQMWHKKKSLVKESVRSPHATNRWLKGVVALFGFAIIIKDSLEVIGAAGISNQECNRRAAYFSNFILHALFIIGQVVLLFFYAKVHIQELKCISRFGVMHIMATNLAVWVSVIADETSHALHLRVPESHSLEKCYEMTSNSYGKGNYTLLKDGIEAQCSNSSSLLQYLDTTGQIELKNYSGHKSYGGLFSGACTCYTPVCHVIARAEKFLTPLLVEYCLVSSCLLYVMWSHIGVKPKHHGSVPKPSHKFYKSYKGVMFGAIMLIVTVIILTLLGTLDSGMETKSYYTESQNLAIYDSYLFSFNLTILIACGLGFYAYSVAKLKKNEIVNLDIVLLFICVTGPLLIGLFSILGLCAGPESKKGPGWVMSLFSSLADVIVTIVQVLFAIHGLNKEPGTSNTQIASEERNDESSLNVLSFYNKNTEEKESQKSDEEDADIKMEKSKRTESTSSDFNKASNSSEPSNQELAVEETVLPDPPVLTLVNQQDFANGSKVIWTDYNAERRRPAVNFQQPARIRIVIRDIMIFLVMCNTCLYIFLSLNATVYRVYPFASEFFGHSAWTTLASVTAPLSIFLKLHFAACFFEIWSYS